MGINYDGILLGSELLPGFFLPNCISLNYIYKQNGKQLFYCLDLNSFNSSMNWLNT